MSNHLEDKYGERGRVGALGEDYFDRALKRAGLDKYPKFRSLNIPDVPGRPSVRGDVDCVIANGNKIVLVDVKRWKGFILWTLKLREMSIPMKGLFPLVMGGKWTLSKNMEMARERVRHHLPNAEVSAMVVFVPTNHDHGSVPFSVNFLIWPGWIRSYVSGDAFDELYARLGDKVEEVHPQVMHLLTRLKRKG